MKTLIAPCVHLNGTGKARLHEALREAIIAVQAAQELLMLTAPHGRDYYPLDNGSPYGVNYNAASAEHKARMERLWSVSDELLAIMDAVDQGQAGPVPYDGKDK